MKPVRDSNLEFWLALLKFGDDEGRRRRNWNAYCLSKYPAVIGALLSDGNLEDLETKLGFHLGMPGTEIPKEIDAIANEHGGHPQFPGASSGPVEQFMDFSGKGEFGEDISFAGRILIDADFRGVTFRGQADFGKAELLGRTQFDNARFLGSSYFDDAVFADGARYDGTEFRGVVTFNNAKFRNTTSFRGASFGRPPKFFETEIHEDVDFGGADWTGAEDSCSPWLRRSDEPEFVGGDAGEAVRAWDRLALIMSGQEKPAERHGFFRLRMRAQRWRDGWTVASVLNLAFDLVADYGWGIRRSLLWWAGHVAVGGVILADGWQSVPNGLLVSLSNSVAFLRLSAEGGHLHGPYRTLETATGHADWVFGAVGTVQAFLGPILLFLVLLTLRNRFRIG